MEDRWPAATVEEIAAETPGAIAIGPFGSAMKADCYVSDGVPVIRGTNLTGNREFRGELMYVSDETADRLARSNVRAGDLVFPHRGAIGEVGLVPKGPVERWMLSTSLMKLTCDPQKADPKFIYYFFKSPLGRHELLQYASTVGTPGIGQPLTSLKACRVPAAPLPEQRRIAAVLGALDDKIELNRKMNQTLEAMAQALFKSWFVDFDPVIDNALRGGNPIPDDLADKAERRRAVMAREDYAVPEYAGLFPNEFMESELGWIPVGWAACPLYDCATYINGAAYRAFEPNTERRGLPIIKIAELKAGVTERTKFSDVEMPEKYRLDRGDILFSWSGNPDTSIDTFVWAHGPAWLNQHIFRVVPHNNNERSFALATLKHLRPVFAEIARDKQTTGLGHVTVRDMKRLHVVWPEERVLDLCSNVLGPLLDRSFQGALESATLATTRDTLLPKLISGEVRVPEGLGDLEA